MLCSAWPLRWNTCWRRAERARGLLFCGAAAFYLHVVEQPYRLRHLRRAQKHVVQARENGTVWITTPGAIYEYVSALEISV
jgi:hypothetical protein